MKKLSNLFIFLALFCAASTVKGADYLPSIATVNALRKATVQAAKITLAKAPLKKIANHGCQFIVDAATFGAVFYLHPNSILTLSLGGLAVWVSGHRIKESASSYLAWLQEKPSTSPQAGATSAPMEEDEAAAGKKKEE